MSDREQIIHFLEKAEKRARSNKRFNDIAKTLAIAFVVPVVFKLLDFYFLFRGRTVVTFLGLWALATLVWILARMRGKSPLNQVAGKIDNWPLHGRTTRSAADTESVAWLGAEPTKC